MSAGPQRNTDLVPLDERLLYLRVLRAVIAAATVLDATLLPHLLRRPFLTVAVSAMGYLLVSLLAAVHERELRRRRYELEQLAQMGRSLEEAHDPLGVGDVLLDALADTFQFRRMALFEVAADSPRLLTCRNLLDAVVADFTVGPASVLSTAAAERRTLLVSEMDPALDPWLTAIMPDARNIAIVPLAADAVVGVLVAETGRRPGSRIERRVVATAERFA